MVVVEVDKVGRRATLGLRVGQALDYPVRVELVAAVRDGKDDPADAQHWLELVRCGRRPCGAVVGADVGAPPPTAQKKSQIHHVFEEERGCSRRI